MIRELSQQEIDAVFQSRQEGAGADARALPLDFRRTDRIAKSQLRAIHLLHESFVRSFSSSVSAYLRSDLSGNLISVEQIAFADFLGGLPSPCCAMVMRLKPYDTPAILDISPSLVFPILDLVTGGKGKIAGPVDREVSEIEQQLLEDMFRIIAQSLGETWKVVTELQFVLESLETSPQLVRALSPNEAVVAIAMEFQIAGQTGMMNLAIPSVTIMGMAQKFEQHSAMKTRLADADQRKMLRLLEQAHVRGEAKLSGGSIRLGSLMQLKEGMVILFDHAVDKPLEFLLNGRPAITGRIVCNGHKRAFLVE